MLLTTFLLYHKLFVILIYFKTQHFFFRPSTDFMLLMKIVSYTLLCSFVVPSSTKLPYIFIIFLSLWKKCIFYDHLGLIFCFSYHHFTHFLENSFFPMRVRKRFYSLHLWTYVILLKKVFIFLIWKSKSTVFVKGYLALFSKVAFAMQRCICFPDSLG